MQAPERPYKSFQEYRSKVITRWGAGHDLLRVIAENPTAWPCVECGGETRVIDPRSLGVYEGRAEYLPCPRCKKTGLGSEAEHKEIYRQKIAVYRDQKEKYQALMRVYRSAMKKLSKAEIVALKQFGFKPLQPRRTK